MVSYIFQGILFIMITALVILKKEKLSKDIRVLVILASSLCLANTMLNLMKLFLSVDIDLYNTNLYQFFGLSVNILSILVLAVLAVMLILIFLKIKSKKRSEIRDTTAKPNKILNLIAVFIILLCIFVSFVTIPNIDYSATLHNELMDNSENKEINIKSNNHNDIKIFSEILDKMENDYITDDINELISELKNCKDIKLNFVDENIEAYTGVDGVRVFDNYIKPIATDKVIKNNRTRMYFSHPEVGIYTIASFEYLYVAGHEFSYNNVILVFGYADRGGIINDLTFDKDEVVYVYLCKKIMELPKIGFCSFNGYNQFEYFYEFVDEGLVH